jgi:hypothetical protein
MKFSSPVQTPVSLSKPTSVPNKSTTNLKVYQSIVGSLMYLMIWTRPDISLAVNLLARKLQDPTQEDMTSAKRVLWYVR